MGLRYAINRVTVALQLFNNVSGIAAGSPREMAEELNYKVVGVQRVLNFHRGVAD